MAVALALGVLSPIMTAKRDGSRSADMQQLAARLSAAREQFSADIARGLGGRAAHARFSDRLDDLLRQVVSASDLGTPVPLAVCATGGYGRRTLCLHSDIDLLIVFDGTIGRAEERFVKDVLHPLWDLRLTVGHQVRTLADMREIEHDNPELLLALLDLRLIAGEPSVFEEVDERFRRANAACRDQVIAGLERLTAARYAQFNDTVYQLEPDVKESPGGLRDIAAARVYTWLADDATAALVDEDRIDQAEGFLLRVRSVLHLDAGRNMNVLSHPLQEVVADRLHIPGATPQQRVEALMSRYFGHAKVVARAVGRARRLMHARRGSVTWTAVGSNLQVTLAGVEFSDAERASADPASWLQAFEVALEYGAPVADETLALIERRSARYALTDFLPTPQDRARLLQLLRPRTGLYDRLSELHECGLLGKLFPGFNAISSRVIRDFYHKYTVDEHTLLTIRGLERLLTADSSRERFGAVLAELHAPERLVLALLFHDVGKWKEEAHAEESARMARGMLAQLDVPADARDDIEFLIAEHLQMSVTAFRRDSDDPGIVQRFAAFVGTEERLKMLCLLTFVDIQAVSPGTLTPWKEELLWRLYVDTYNELTIAYGDQVIDREQAAVAALQATRPSDISEAELARFLEGLPQRYLATVDRAHVYQHARLARDIHADEVRLFLEPRGGAWELAVVTLDKPQLFANICGVLSYCGMDILRGSAMTSPSGLVLDLFQFTDQEQFFKMNADAPSQLERLLKDVVAGRQDIAALLRRKASGPSHRRSAGLVRPIVYFDTEHSQHYTVLEIVAQNRLGLLHGISRVISQHGCDVELVLIATEGSKAIDVFHLTRSGAKLPALARGALKADLERMLEEGYEKD